MTLIRKTLLTLFAIVAATASVGCAHNTGGHPIHLTAVDQTVLSHSADAADVVTFAGVDAR